MRLAGRVPRLGRALLVLAAVAGLVVAVWTGPAAAGTGPKMMRVRTATEVDGGPPGMVWIKACGLNEDSHYLCTGWTQVGSYVFTTPFPGLLWQRIVTVCKGGQAVSVRVPTREDVEDDSFLVDLATVERGDTPSLECL